MNTPLLPSTDASNDEWANLNERDRNSPPGPWGFRIFLLFILGGLTYSIHNIYQSMWIDRIEPLGPVMAMGATADMPTPLWFVQTTKGYYPVQQPVSLQVGAELVLVTMLSGDQFLCNADRSVCASTSKAGRHLAQGDASE